jgi:hypothetical protein
MKVVIKAARRLGLQIWGCNMRPAWKVDWGVPGRNDGPVAKRPRSRHTRLMKDSSFGLLFDFAWTSRGKQQTSVTLDLESSVLGLDLPSCCTVTVARISSSAGCALATDWPQRSGFSSLFCGVGEAKYVAQKRRHADGLLRLCCRRIGFRERSINDLRSVGH